MLSITFILNIEQFHYSSGALLLRLTEQNWFMYLQQLNQSHASTTLHMYMQQSEMSYIIMYNCNCLASRLCLVYYVHRGLQHETETNKFLHSTQVLLSTNLASVHAVAASTLMSKRNRELLYKVSCTNSIIEAVCCHCQHMHSYLDIETDIFLKMCMCMFALLPPASSTCVCSWGSPAPPPEPCTLFLSGGTLAGHGTTHAWGKEHTGVIQHLVQYIYA